MSRVTSFSGERATCEEELDRLCLHEVGLPHQRGGGFPLASEQVHNYLQNVFQIISVFALSYDRTGPLTMPFTWVILVNPTILKP